MTDDNEKRRWKGKPPKGGGERQLSTRVKNKKLDESSRNCVRRQLNDPYVARARGDGYRARAAYKLLELDEQFHFLKRGQRVIDLGAAPGGWAQVAVQRGAVQFQRRHGRHLALRQLAREGVLFQDLPGAPAAGPVELGHHRLPVFQVDLVDAVLVGAQGLQPAVAVQAERGQRVQHHIGRERFVRMRHGGAGRGHGAIVAPCLY